MGDRDDQGRGYVLEGQRVEAPALPAALHLVATPIGNLADITLRALRTLAAADIVACEDTRVTRVLLQHYGIGTRTVSYHEHNAAEAGAQLVERLKGGQSVALVSDAGTPLLSDPGYRLVGSCIEAGIDVVPIPGASALLAALTASSLPTDSFFFAGFLPAKSGARTRRLEEIAAVPSTLVFYESPRRLAACLAEMAEVLGGDRPASVGRELTKRFEEFRRGTLGELAGTYSAEGPPKGECVICVGPPLAEERIKGEALDDLLRGLADEMPTKKAAATAAERTGLPRTELYNRLIALKADGS